MLNARRVSAADDRLRIKFSGVAAVFEEFGRRLFRSSPSLREDGSGPSRPVETLLRRSIPILIIAFLSVVALARFVGILSEHGRMEASIRQSTSLISATAQAALSTHPEMFATRNREGAEQALFSYLSPEHLSDGAFVLLVDPAGRVFGASPGASGQVGFMLASLLPEVTTIRRFGDRSGAIETNVNGEPHYAVVTPVGTDGALILTAHSLQSVNEFWRRELSLNVTLFAGISLTLLVVLYAYFHQVRRAREADDIFLESNMRVEAALSRDQRGAGGFELVGAGAIERDRRMPRRNGGERSMDAVEPGPVAPCDRNPGAVVREPARRLGTDPAGAAGDQHGLACHIHRKSPFDRSAQRCQQR